MESISGIMYAASHSEADQLIVKRWLHACMHAITTEHILYICFEGLVVTCSTEDCNTQASD